MDLASDMPALFAPRANLVEFSKSVLGGVEIKSCRRSPYDYKAHVHQELTLAYIHEGSTDLTLSDGVIHFTAGSGAVIPPFVSHRCAPNDIDRWAYVVVFVDPALYGGEGRFSRVRKLEGEQAQLLAEGIAQLCAQPEPDTASAVLYQLLAEFGDDDAPSAAPAETLEAVRAYLQQNVETPVSLEQLEKIFGMNRFSLIKGFRRAYATTPTAFHLQCRVCEAKTMIGMGIDVFEICDALHFYDQAHLIREFRKMYGITPAAYREQLHR